MIEAIKAKNGSAVLRIDGRWLSSSVDPEREAHEWLSRRREFLDKVKAVFVLGAGCGYHIAELARHTQAKIIVLEISPEIIEAVRAIQVFDSRQVKFEVIDGLKKLRATESVRQAVAGSFVVLQHGPSLAANATLYREIHAQLIGRDWGSLHWQWQLKGFAALDGPTQIQPKGQEPLSILDLEQTELVRDSKERERMLLKALRELIK